MKISKKEFEKIKNLMPIERKPEKISNQQFLNALLYMVENGCKWKTLQKKFGNWRTIYMRFNRWTKNGTIQRIFEELQEQKVIETQSEILSLDSNSIKVHPKASGARKSVANKALIAQRGVNNEDTCGLYI